MGGFLELSYGLSFLVVTILASTFQFLSSKNLYQKRSEDFPGVRTILKTYPDFLLNSIVTFPHHVHLPILLTSWDYAWMKWPLQSVGHFALEDGFHVLLTLSSLRREKWSFAFPTAWTMSFAAVQTTFRKQQTTQLKSEIENKNNVSQEYAFYRVVKNHKFVPSWRCYTLLQFECFQSFRHARRISEATVNDRLSAAALIRERHLLKLRIKH